MRLTDKAIRAAAPKDKPYKLADGQGLYLLVSPGGKKTWNVKFRLAGSEKKLRVGSYPEISIKQAREALANARTQLANGMNPMKARRARAGEGVRFRVMAEEWAEKQKARWTADTYEKTLSRMKRFVYPHIGGDAMDAIEPPDVLDLLRPIEAKGLSEQAHRTLQNISQIFRYAIATRRAQRDPTGDLRGALSPIKKGSFAHLPAKELPDLLQKLQSYHGTETVALAAQFLIHVFGRTIEVRYARWDQIDENERLWRIPPEIMKMRRPHLVPLSKQALAILEEMRAISGRFELIFPNPRNPHKPLSDSAILSALYALGYKGRATGHGFRHTASTTLNENGFTADAIERQLAHIDRNKIRGVYNHAEYLPERKKMMQWWSDYLESRA